MAENDLPITHDTFCTKYIDVKDFLVRFTYHHCS